MLTVAQLFFWLILYSFIGWVYESTLCSVTQHKLVNRGFLAGPLCPIYGFGALVIILCLGREANSSILSLFLSGAVLTCTLEYLTSWLMEKLFHARWWDYSHYRFQLNGRVCLLGAVAFGTMSVLILKVVHPFVKDLTERIPEQILYIICGLLLLLVAADTVTTVRSVVNMNQKLAEVQAALDRIKERVSDVKDDISERRGRLHDHGQKILERVEQNSLWTNRVKELLSQRRFQERRLLKEFPRFAPVNHRDALEVLKAKLEEFRREKRSK